MDPGDIETLGEGQELLIECGAAHKEDFFVVVDEAEGLGDGVDDVDALEGEVFVVGEDDVAALGEGFLVEGVEGAAAHDDGVSGGEGLEAFEVVGDMPKEVVVAADGEVFGDGDYDGEVVGEGFVLYHINYMLKICMERFNMPLRWASMRP